MKNLTKIIPLLALAFSCQKEEPFEYPEQTDKIPSRLIVYSERTIHQDENWIVEKLADGCASGTPLDNLAAHELNYDKGFAVMHLIPTSTDCELDLELHSEISNNEISSFLLDSLIFEFTFFEFATSPGSEFWVSLYYKNLELDLNLGPHIDALNSVDKSNGLFKMEFQDAKPVCSINGIPISPDFSAGAENHFSLNGSESENYYHLKLFSRDVDQQSYVAFKYMRISRFGIPEA